jgi:hypothetical protein
MHARFAPALLVALVALASACDAGGDRSAADAPGRPVGEGAGWSFAEPMSQRRSYVAAAELGGRIYVAGGMVGETGRRLALFERFDPAKNAWTTLAPVPAPVRAGAGAALGGAVYVVGGATEDGPGPQVFAFDVRRGAWSERAPLPEPRYNHAAVALGGKLYVLGGYRGDREQDDVFVYDPGRDRWRRAAPLPRPSHAFGAVAFRGEIWVIGGRRGEAIVREVWIYDPDRDRWRAGPTLPDPMELLGAAAAGSEIHAVWESTYHVYDAGAAVWRKEPPPTVHRHALSLFALDEALYAVGGCTTELRDTQVVEILDLRSEL